MQYHRRLWNIAVLNAAALVASQGVLAAGGNDDPLDGTGIANNPNAQYDTVFGSICSYKTPADGVEQGGGARVFSASLHGQGDEGFSVAFGTTFDCEPLDPSVGRSQEQVDGDPLPSESQ